MNEARFSSLGAYASTTPNSECERGSSLLNDCSDVSGFSLISYLCSISGILRDGGSGNRPIN